MNALVKPWCAIRDPNPEPAESVRPRAPAPVCPRGARLGNQRWPLAQPLFVALDLAQDPGRGREILNDWTPPEPWHRVW